MRDQILAQLDNAQALEQLYRANKVDFKRAFNALYPEFEDRPMAQGWHARLNFQQPGRQSISWGKSNELTLVIVLSLLAGFIAKVPSYAGINEDFFYPRNLAFVVFPLLSAYFCWRQGLSVKKILIAGGITVLAALYINFLPDKPKSDSIVLACMHLPLLLWSILGFCFTGNGCNQVNRRLDFLRYNGDLIVMTTLILIAGGLLTGITVGLFSLIKIDITRFYMSNIVVFGLAASPIVATYLVQSNPQLVNSVSPVIAKVFTPLVLVTLLCYLIAVIVTGKDPYNNREFLLVFNGLLIGVMAIILFSIAETAKNSESKVGIYLLLSLSILTIILNGIALTAILFRISEWGITPNRIAVLAGNLLILSNLLWVTAKLWNTARNRGGIDQVEYAIAKFLPIYSIWTIIVVFLFPFFFNFK